jgi:hypothetical protein
VRCRIVAACSAAAAWGQYLAFLPSLSGLVGRSSCTACGVGGGADACLGVRACQGLSTAILACTQGDLECMAQARRRGGLQCWGGGVCVGRSRREASRGRDRRQAAISQGWCSGVAHLVGGRRDEAGRAAKMEALSVVSSVSVHMTAAACLDDADDAQRIRSTRRECTVVAR